MALSQITHIFECLFIFRFDWPVRLLPAFLNFYGKRHKQSKESTMQNIIIQIRRACGRSEAAKQGAMPYHCVMWYPDITNIPIIKQKDNLMGEEETGHRAPQPEESVNGCLSWLCSVVTLLETCSVWTFDSCHALSIYLCLGFCFWGFVSRCLFLDLS